jgi:hypothetical protein
LFPLFAFSVIDTGGKFSAGVNDTSGKLAPVANLPPVSLIPVVHLRLRIFPRILKKIRKGPIGIFEGLGEDDSLKKNLKAKNLVTLSVGIFPGIFSPNRDDF